MPVASAPNCDKQMSPDIAKCLKFRGGEGDVNHAGKGGKCMIETRERKKGGCRSHVEELRLHVIVDMEPLRGLN